MARGELMKKLLASYGRDDEFRAVAEQIIDEEEKKNNRVLARSLRKTLEGSPSRSVGPRALRRSFPSLKRPRILLNESSRDTPGTISFLASATSESCGDCSTNIAKRTRSAATA